MTSASVPSRARVLFDEAHSEAWSIHPEVAERMQAAHPADASLQRAARLLERRDFAVASHDLGPLGAEALAEADVLVIPHPSDPRWEATTGSGEPRLSSEEIAAIAAWVDDGGGLIVLGETEQEKYGNNLNDLLTRFGIEIETATVQDYEHHREAPSWVLADLVRPNGKGGGGADPLAGVAEACFYRAGILAVGDDVRVIARTSPDAAPPRSPLAAVAEHGRGRVAVLADSDLFGDDCIGDLDHEALWVNLVYWAAGHAFAGAVEQEPSPAAADPAWAELKAAVEELRPAQENDGSVDLGAHDGYAMRKLSGRIGDAARRLVRHFPHQEDYVEALEADLLGWAEGGFGKPDFARATEAFRPELRRRDGIEHLAVFPMYKQNGPPGTCFEALIVRVPWPSWAVELEQRYDNEKYVPVELVDYTPGYDSECAVLFPETFSVAERAPAHFGAIFCDREAERFRRVCGAAAEILNPEGGKQWAIALGKALFWDEQLSSTKTVSCGTCHRPAEGGSDPRTVINDSRSRNAGADNTFNTADDVFGSPGVPVNNQNGTYTLSDYFGFNDQVTNRKSPSYLNAGYSPNGLFWDGRATDLIDPKARSSGSGYHDANGVHIHSDGAAAEPLCLHQRRARTAEWIEHHLARLGKERNQVRRQLRN